MKSQIKNFVLRLVLGYKRADLLSEASLSIVLVNFLFQKVFRLNSSSKELIHFSSQSGGFDKVQYHLDRNTLKSFCVSGGCYFQAINGIELGRNFLFAPGIKLISANHDPKDHSKWIKENPIKIGENVWLGANVVVLPGVEIANDCVVGAGSVVSKSLMEPNCIYAGVPAKRIKKING